MRVEDKLNSHPWPVIGGTRQQAPWSESNCDRAGGLFNGTPTRRRPWAVRCLLAKGEYQDRLEVSTPYSERIGDGFLMVASSPATVGRSSQ